MRSYTADEYRAAGPNAGPYALEANPDHNYRTARRKPILGVVMHITAGLSDYTLPDVSAEGTTRYGATTARDASWHVCIDSDGIIPSIRDSYVAWHAGVPDIPNVNDATLGIEQGTGTTNWDAKPRDWVERTVRNCAVWLAPRVKAHGIPLVVLRDRAELDRAIRAGRKFGFISHATVAPSNRTDPGIYQGRDTYPWSLLFQYIREELAGTPTTPEDDMLFNDTVPGSNPPLTVGQCLIRGAHAYAQVIEGGSIDHRLDTATAELADLRAAVEAGDTAQAQAILDRIEVALTVKPEAV